VEPAFTPPGKRGETLVTNTRATVAAATPDAIVLGERRPLPGSAIDATAHAMRRLSSVIAALQGQLHQPCPACASRRWAISEGGGGLRLACRSCGWSRHHIDDSAASAPPPTRTP
jgi:hypothetical protein